MSLGAGLGVAHGGLGLGLLLVYLGAGGRRLVGQSLAGWWAGAGLAGWLVACLCAWLAASWSLVNGWFLVGLGVFGELVVWLLGHW